jgi:heat shock protein HtpX
MDNLFSTHPSTENRVAALMQLAQQMGPVAGPARGAAPGGFSQASSPWGAAAPRRQRGPWG